MRRKKQQQSVTAKKSRAKHRCDPKVKRLIDLINCVPPDRDLPGLPKMFERGDEDARVAEEMRALIAEVPPDFVSVIPGRPWPPLKLNDEQRLLVARYDYFRWLRNNVRKIIGRGKFLSLSLEVRLEYAWAEITANPIEHGWFDPVFMTSLTINKAGLIVSKPDEWLSVLIDIEAARLRECAVCGRIFWAEDKRSMACPARCNNAFRQRRWREKQHKYEANRAEKERTASRKAGSAKKRK